MRSTQAASTSLAKTSSFIADNFFFKTRANIEAGSPAALLFLTNDGKSYQIKGTIELLAEG